MEITQQPSTIGEMSLDHFQTFITGVVKRTVHEIVDPQFEMVEQRLNAVDERLDKVEKRLDVVEHRLIDIDERLTSLEDRFDRFERSNDVMGTLVLRHDSRLRDWTTA